MLDLQKVRERVSAVSPRFTEAVDSVVRGAIERHLTPADFYTPYDQNYLIVFGDILEDVARSKCALMAREISNWLAGENGLQGLSVVTTVVDMGSDRDGNEGEGVKTLSRRLDAAAAKADLRQDAGIELRNANSTGLPQNIFFLYRPMWFVGRKVISTYLCMPAWTARTGLTLTGDSLLGDPNSVEQTVELDFRVLAEVGKTLRARLEISKPQLVAMPVHFSTVMSQASRQEYLTRLRLLPAECHRMIVLEMIGIPARVPHSRVLEASLWFKEMSRTRIARLSLDRPEFDPFKDSDYSTIGLDVSESVEPEARLIGKIEQFAKQATRFKLKTYIHGLQSLSMTTAAVCAGFDFIDGDRVMSVVDAPRGLYPLDPESLYQHLLKKTAS